VKSCLTCKKEFKSYHNLQKYCSKICYEQSQKHYCVDCKIELFGHNNKTPRCTSCAKKGKLNPIHKIDRNGTNNPMFGKTGHWIGQKRPDMTQRMLGVNNINYIDGSSGIYAPEFNKYLKNQIRDRDNYECQNCYITEEEHIIIYGQILHIHHIDYNKTNCNNTNLITLCLQCNIRANKNRDIWSKFYTALLEIKE